MYMKLGGNVEEIHKKSEINRIAEMLVKKGHSHSQSAQTAKINKLEGLMGFYRELMSFDETFGPDEKGEQRTQH